MFANKLKNFAASNVFLFAACALIFLLSIYLRSTIDIGADTGVYLDLGKKVFEGKKYYYDFFESNFPISFYFYALQYKAAQLLGLSPVIMSEICINLLALLSIFSAAKILQRSTVFVNRISYNLIVISYFLGFFLRPYALQVGEFGTKTSLLLLLLYPYISYSFERLTQLNKSEQIYRGFLMGLIPCIKPHYLILLILVEAQRFWQKKNLRFFIELDKLVMMFIGSLILLLMVKFTPQYFEFIPSMWGKTYDAYNAGKNFIKNSWHNAAIVAQFIFVFLLFARKKITQNDKIIFLFFISAAFLVIIENLGTIDQMVVFYAVSTIAVVKFSYDIFVQEENIFSQNRFIILAVILLPLFELEALPAAFLGLSGFVNLWWAIALLYPLLNYKKFSAAKYFIYYAVYFAFLTIGISALKYMGGWAYVALNLSILFSVLFFFERQRKTFSAFSIFVIFATISTLLYCYVTTIIGVISRESSFTSPNQLTDVLMHYNNKYAPKNDENFLMVSIWIAHQFPALNYLNKDNPQKFHMAVIQADKGVAGSSLMFPIKDPAYLFAYSYLFDDVKNAVKNKKTKVIFFNNSRDILNKKNGCLIPTLEYYLLDPDFRKNFLENFHFENHVILTHKVRPLKKINFITREKSSVFDEVKPSSNQVLYDLEVYVRN